MVNSYFDQAFKFTVGNEGGYTNDPADRGGPTNWGITQHDLSVELGRPASPAEVKAMKIETAKGIYLKRYWKPMGCDFINDPGVTMCMFDIGVVRGIGVPPVYAQKICNQHGAHLVVDGQLGPLSLAVINEEISPSVFIRDFSVMVESGFRQIAARNPSQNRFLKGWINRAHRLLTLAGT